MIIDGVDLAGLAHKTERVLFPNEVKGRVAHIDGDFLAYQCAYEKEGEEKSFEDMKYNTGIAIETLRRMAGASDKVLHLTPMASNKGGRHDIALLREYQANRKDRKTRPRFLEELRIWMHIEHKAKQWLTCEADDGMSSAQYKAIADKQRNLSIIVTKDKDLRMVPGLHLNWSTGAIVDTDAWGYIKLNDQRKLKGFGTKWFWAQMLMGDKVDNISGLPRLCLDNKIKPVGDVGAFALLNDIQNDKEAFTLVRNLYNECGNKAKQYMVDYRTGKAITPDLAFVSEGKLLWMRRNTNDPDDVVKWMAETCKK